MNGRYTFYRTLIVALTLLGLFVLWLLGETIIVLLGAIIFASAIRPLVNRLIGLRVPAWLSILTIYAALFVTLGTLIAFAIPPLFEVIASLLQDEGILYQLIGLAYGWADKVGYEQMVMDAYPRLMQEWATLPQTMQAMALERGPATLQSVGLTLSQLALGLIMAFYWLTARDQIQGFMLSLTPVRHRGQVETIFNDVEGTLGAYVRGTVILMSIVGLASYIGLVALGVPYALPLALIAGVTEAIPMIGPFIGAVPAVLIAFSISPSLGILTLVLYTVIQQVENSVLVPRIMEHSVGLNPLLVIIALVAGGTLKGTIGAILAIPLAGALQVMLRYLVVEPMIEEANESHMEGGITIFDVEPANEEPTSPNEIIIAQ
jgi:predicted PurR-regulated permease PerM